MNNKRFEEILGRHLKHIESTLRHKNKEYGLDDDRLNNFRIIEKLWEAFKVANPNWEINSLTMAWFGVVSKHIGSIIVMLANPDLITQELIDEKVGDDACYNTLLRAIFEELLDEKKMQAAK